MQNARGLTTIRHKLTPTRMAINKAKTKTENNKCWQGCGEIGTLVNCWQKCNIETEELRLFTSWCRKTSVRGKVIGKRWI